MMIDGRDSTPRGYAVATGTLADCNHDSEDDKANRSQSRSCAFRYLRRVLSRSRVRSRNDS